VSLILVCRVSNNFVKPRFERNGGVVSKAVKLFTEGSGIMNLEFTACS